MVTYTVALRPLRLDSAALVAGCEYVVRYHRKGVELATHPQLCRSSGVVAFTATPLTAWHAFEVSFASTSNRRALEFAVDDVTGARSGKRRPPVVCVAGGVRLELVTCCDVFAREAIHRVVELPMQITGRPAALRVALLMFPSGSPPPPPPPRQQIAAIMESGAERGHEDPNAGSNSNTSSGSGGVPIPPSAAAPLIAAGHLAPQLRGALVDADIAAELTVLGAQLTAMPPHAAGPRVGGDGGAAAAPESAEIAAHIAALERRIELAAIEGRRLRAEAAAITGEGGDATTTMAHSNNSNSSAQRAGASRAGSSPQRETSALAALKQERRAYEEVLHSLRAALEEAAAAEKEKEKDVEEEEKGAGESGDGADGGLLSPGESDVDETAAVASGARDSELVRSLRSELAATQAQLAALEAEQAHRDVGDEACELLAVADNLEKLLGEALAADRPAVGHHTGGGKATVTGTGGARSAGRARRVTFALEAARHESPPRPQRRPQHRVLHLIDAVLEQRCRRRGLKFAVAGACALIAGRPIPPLPPLPPRGAPSPAATAAAAPPAPFAGSAQTVAATTTKGGAPAGGAVAVAAPVPAAAATAQHSDIFDDLFGPPAPPSRAVTEGAAGGGSEGGGGGGSRLLVADLFSGVCSSSGGGGGGDEHCDGVSSEPVPSSASATATTTASTTAARADNCDLFASWEGC